MAGLLCPLGSVDNAAGAAGLRQNCAKCLNPGDARLAEAAKIRQSQIVTSAASKARSHRDAEVPALASLEG